MWKFSETNETLQRRFPVRQPNQTKNQLDPNTAATDYFLDRHWPHLLTDSSSSAESTRQPWKFEDGG